MAIYNLYFVFEQSNYKHFTKTEILYKAKIPTKPYLKYASVSILIVKSIL